MAGDGERTLLGRLAWWAARGLDGVAALVLFLLMAMTCVDVAGRYLFNRPLTGATELTELMMGLLVFAALPVVTARGGHIVVDLLDPVYPPWLARLRDGLCNAIVALALGVVAWRVLLLAERSASYGDRTPYLAIPLYPTMTFIGVMAGFAAVSALARAVLIVWTAKPR